MNALSPREFEVAAEESFAAVQRSLAENANGNAVSLTLSAFLCAEERNKIRNRISRAQGQLAGILRMIDSRVALPDVIIQMRAATKAVRRTAVRLLIVGYGVNAANPRGETEKMALTHGFQILASMGAGGPSDVRNSLPRLISGQQALDKAQALLEKDGSYLEMVAALAVAGRAINDTSFALLLDRLAEAHIRGDLEGREACEKLLMAYA